MATAKIAQGARTQLTGAAGALNALPNGTFIVLGTITHNSGAKVPVDCIVELTVTPGTVSGNKQVILYAKSSLDGTNFSSGPASGTTITDVSNLIPVGVLPLNTAAAQQRRHLSLASVMPGNLLPFATTLIAFNDTGVSIAASGNDVYTQDASGDIT